MRHAIRFCTALSTAACLSACSTQGSTMLVFGQTQTLGIAIGGSVTDQGATFTLGYQDKNFAIVPATVRQADGSSIQVLSGVGNAGSRSRQGQGQDALSVLGQFSVNTSSKTADVGLGKFFATGLAAQKLADGFSEQLANSRSEPQAAAAKAKAPALAASAATP
jgi:hypothetical protein